MAGQNPFWRRVGVLFTGSGLAQLILVGCSPLLTRFFGPEAFGRFAIYTGILSIVTPLATGRLELQVATRPDEEVPAAIRAAAMLSLLVSLLCGVVSAAWLWRGGLSTTDVLFSFLITFGVLSMSVEALGSHAAVRYGRFALLSVNGVLRSVLIVATQLWCAVLGIAELGMIIGDAVGRFVSSMRLLTKSLIGRLKRSPSTTAVSFLVANRRYVGFAGVGGAVNSLGLQAPALLLAAFYGEAAAGQFALAQRIIGLPVRLVGQSIAKAFLGVVGEHKDDPVALRRAYDRTVLVLFALSAPAIGLIAFSSEWWIELIFGEGWGESAKILRATAIVSAMQFAVGSMAQTLNALGKAGRQAVWELSRALLVGGSIAAAHLLGFEMTEAIWGYSIFASVSYLSLFITTRAAMAWMAHDGAKAGRPHGEGGGANRRVV